MLVVTRFRVESAAAAPFLEDARALVDVLAEQPGHLSAYVGRAIDDPMLWVIATVWEDVGSYRRALTTYQVKIAAASLFPQALDEPTAFEVLSEGDNRTALAADAGVVGVGEAAAPVVPTDLD